MNDYEAEELKFMLNQGMKAQLMRGDRDLPSCWHIALKVIEKLNHAIDRMRGAE
jgi:hypothetical protein